MMEENKHEYFGVNTGTNLEFLYNDASMAYLGRTDVSVIDFTGQHRSFPRRCIVHGV